MHDFACPNYDDMYYDILADRVKRFKTDEKEVAKMGGIFEEIIKERDKLHSHDLAMQMINDGLLSYENISRYSQLSLDEVKALAESRSA